MPKRLNPGRGEDLPILFDNIEYTNPESHTLELWTLYDRGGRDGFERWKLSASEGTSVLGKANYSLAIKEKSLWTKDDGSALKADRPELFMAISLIAEGKTPPQETLAEDPTNDPFGDVANANGRKLTQVQDWNRALLNMRTIELHWQCRPDLDEPANKNQPDGPKVRDMKAKSWDQAVRQTWFGIYRDNWDRVVEAHKGSIFMDAVALGTKEKPAWTAAVGKLAEALTTDMPEDMLRGAVEYIIAAAKPIALDELKAALKTAHSGKWKPHTYERLDATLNWLVGIGEDPALGDFANVAPALDTGDLSDLL